jgi:hypothetical protein
VKNSRIRRGHLLCCTGRTGPAFEPCSATWRGAPTEYHMQTQAVMLRSGWTLLAGTNRLLCPSCSIDVRTALTLGPCVECGGLLLHQRAYILYPQLRVDRVRDGGKQRCQSCRGRAQRRTTGPQAPRAPLDEVEVARLRRLVGITENHRENLSWAN